MSRVRLSWERARVCWKVAGTEIAGVAAIILLAVWAITHTVGFDMAGAVLAGAHLLGAHKRLANPSEAFDAACSLVDLAMLLASPGERRFIIGWLGADNETRSHVFHACERVGERMEDEQGAERSTGRLS
jgi:hypothetical protein